MDFNVQFYEDTIKIEILSHFFCFDAGNQNLVS